MTRAAFVCLDPGVPVFGNKGCSIHVQQLITALRRRGVSLELYVANPEGSAPEGLRGLPVHDLGIGKRRDAADREREVLAANRRLVEALAAAPPFDFVYERHALFSHAAMEYAQRAGIPGLLEINAPLIEEQARHRRLVDLGSAECSASRAFAAASHLLPVSAEVARAIGPMGAHCERTHVIPNGVDPDVFLHSGRGKADPAHFTIGFAGTLRPWHGIEELAEGFERVAAERDDARLLVVGGGDALPALRSRLKASRLSHRCCLAGPVEHREMPRLLSMMDVGVAPYPRLQNFYFSPLKILEYMASGLPTVASRIGQIPLLVRDGVEGLLHDPGDAKEMASCLLRLAADRPLCSALGAEARLRAAKEYSWDHVASRLLQFTAARRDAEGEA
jgi:glycosyltransferase involved in cell wall biosynthesis